MLTGHRGVLGTEILSLITSHGDEPEVVFFDRDFTNSQDGDEFLSRNGHFTHLIHSAALVPVRKVFADPVGAFNSNSQGAGLFVSAFSAKNPNARVLFVSSSHVYRDDSEGPLNELSTTEPSGIYGRSKLSGELILRSLSDVKGFDLCIARVFSLYSESQTGDYLFPSIRRKLESHRPGQPFSLNGWNNVRDFSHAKVHARAILWLVEAGASGIFNVGSGQGETVGNFASGIAGYPLTFADDEKDPRPTRVVADIAKLRQAGYQP